MSNPETVNTYPEFISHTINLDRSLGRFLQYSLEQQLIGPTNAARLVEALPADMYSFKVARGLSAIALQEPDPDEVIAPPLRQLSDFSKDENPYRLKLEASGGKWMDARFSRVDKEKQALVFDEHLGFTRYTYPDYPALFSKKDSLAIQKEVGSGHSKIAYFVTYLGLYTMDNTYHDITLLIARSFKLGAHRTKAMLNLE